MYLFIFDIFKNVYLIYSINTKYVWIQIEYMYYWNILKVLIKYFNINV